MAKRKCGKGIKKKGCICGGMINLSSTSGSVLNPLKPTIPKYAR